MIVAVKGTLRQASALRPLTATRFAAGESRGVGVQSRPLSFVLGRSGERFHLEVMGELAEQLECSRLLQRP